MIEKLFLKQLQKLYSQEGNNAKLQRNKLDSNGVSTVIQTGGK
jgi:hypothetical protein